MVIINKEKRFPRNSPFIPGFSVSKFCILVSVLGSAFFPISVSNEYIFLLYLSPTNGFSVASPACRRNLL